MPSAQHKRPQPFRFHPELETLEDRTLLSAGVLDPTASFGIISSLSYSFDPIPQTRVDVLEPNFATSGKVDFRWLLSPSTAATVTAQPDGKLIVAGFDSPLLITPNGDVGWLMVARFNSDGSLDTSFGTNGGLLLYTGITGHINLSVSVDGKIVVETAATANVSTGDFVQSGAFVARLNADGSYDTSFGYGGSEVTSFGLSAENITINAMSLQADGKIVFVGSDSGTSQIVISSNKSGYLAARLNTDGSLDADFGQ